MNPDNIISISLNRDNETQTVIISKDDSFSISSISEAPLSFSAKEIGTPIFNSYPLKLHYVDSTNDDVSHFMLTENGITLSSQKTITTITPCVYYFGSKTTTEQTQLVEWFGKLDMAGERSKCVDVLKLLEPRIRDMSVIVIGGISGIYADLGLSSRISSNMLGDGINKLMHIVLMMLTNPGSIVLVDEIENGFHYSFYSKLWEIIGRLAKDTKCQVFATTHSYECINGAVALAADNMGLFRFIRLDKIDGAIIPHSFDDDSFEYALKNEWEVR
jgi:hypothetical protein